MIACPALFINAETVLETFQSARNAKAVIRRHRAVNVENVAMCR